MSLTEQWKRGELEDGHYYVKDDDLFVAEFFCGSFMVEEQIITINEVIAPVPTYEQHQEQQATIERYKKALEDVKNNINGEKWSKAPLRLYDKVGTINNIVNQALEESDNGN